MCLESLQLGGPGESGFEGTACAMAMGQVPGQGPQAIKNGGSPLGLFPGYATSEICIILDTTRNC